MSPSCLSVCLAKSACPVCHSLICAHSRSATPHQPLPTHNPALSATGSSHFSSLSKLQLTNSVHPTTEAEGANTGEDSTIPIPCCWLPCMGSTGPTLHRQTSTFFKVVTSTCKFLFWSIVRRKASPLLTHSADSTHVFLQFKFHMQRGSKLSGPVRNGAAMHASAAVHCTITHNYRHDAETSQRSAQHCIIMGFEQACRKANIQMCARFAYVTFYALVPGVLNIHSCTCSACVSVGGQLSLGKHDRSNPCACI